MSQSPSRVRQLGALATALIVGLTGGAVGAVEDGPAEPDPLDILVFSQPYGFSHTDAIVSGAEWFLDLNADPDNFNVVVARDEDDVEGLADDGIEAWEWLTAERLAEFDLLVWNNSTGEVPFPEATRDQMRADVVDWVREGHGILGVHSAADSNYTWPEFHELIGGQYDGHWYAFGGIEVEPYRLQLNVEDPDSPLLAGVDPDYDSHDETYKWQMDVRPDVHVIHSMDNTSIGAQGALYSYHQPLTWCRPVDEGRSFYTNIGHSGYHFTDPNYTTLLSNAVAWTGGRMEADVDCSVPVDPATGVAGADRLGAVWADVDGARAEVSTYSGGLTAITDIVAGESTLTFRDVALDGATAIDIFATAQTIAAPTTIAITGGPFHQRITPAVGGTVEVHLGAADGPVLGEAVLQPAPGALPITSLPQVVNPLVTATGPAASWSKLTASVDAEVQGVHDLVLTFPVGQLNAAAQSVRPEWNRFGSVGWIHVS